MVVVDVVLVVDVVYVVVVEVVVVDIIVVVSESNERKALGTDFHLHAASSNHVKKSLK